MIEKYNGWSIITDREDSLEDLITKRIPYGIYSTLLTAFIKKKLGINEYYLTVYFSNAFHVKKSCSLHSKDSHSLINEANDVIRGVLTQINEDIMNIISELPEI